MAFEPGLARQRAPVTECAGRAAILSRGKTILADDLGPQIRPAASPQEPCSAAALSLKEMMAETERRAIQHALEQAGWNRTKASKLLGISRRQLFDKIRQYGLQQ